jgi:hypothetical protein
MSCYAFFYDACEMHAYNADRVSLSAYFNNGTAGRVSIKFGMYIMTLEVIRTY